MPILDTTYQENVFIETEATLNYDNGEWVNTTDKINVSNIPVGGKPLNKPTYISVKNNGNVFIPHVSSSVEGPFTDNPKLSWMFGLHIYDKPFGFKNLIVIPMVLNYPYLSDDEDYKGQYGTYNGVLTGYQINGVHHKLINITCGDINVPFETVNDDTIENSETKRIFYNTEGNFGSYQIEKIYYYIPIKNNNSEIEYNHIPSDDIKFYKKITLNVEGGGTVSGGTVSGGIGGSVIGGNNFRPINNSYDYIEAKNITPNSIADGNLYVQYNNKACLLEGDSYNNITICTDNGMVGYRKTVDGEFSESNTLNTFQYIELNDNTGNLIVSDGYGSDVEEVIDQYLSFSNTVTYESIKVGDNEQNYLIFDNDGDVPYDNLKLYSSQGGYIQCTEARWETFETEVEEDEDNYVIDIIREDNFWTFYGDDEDRQVSATIIKYTSTINEVEVSMTLKTWYHPKPSWGSIIVNDANRDYDERIVYINNHKTGQSSESDRNLNTHIRTILGVGSDWFPGYKQTGGQYIFTAWKSSDNLGFQNGNFEGSVELNGTNFLIKFDVVTNKFQVYQPYTRSIKPNIIDGKAYITLLNGQTVEVNSDGDFTVNNYPYNISNYNPSILTNSTTNNLPYPLDDKNNIFKLVNKNGNWVNQQGSTIIFTTEEDENKIHFQVDGNNEFYFAVGYYQMEDGPQHIIYSPKYCVRQPTIVYDCDDTDTNTNKDKYTFTINPDGNGENKYFKNYSFSWTCKFTKTTTENNNTITEYETESGILTPEDLIGGVYTIEIEIESGFNSQPVIWELQDVTNLIFKDIKAKPLPTNN